MHLKNGNIEDFGSPMDGEIELINRYTRRDFKADELYVFSVTLCDNEVDRDFERFTDESLETLAEMFVGKTGIFDHSHKAENQCARIFSAKVETVENKQNSVGMPYKRLAARAYMPKSEAFDGLILSIESGIKKEVSVGCSMGGSVCSVCGKPYGDCQHRKGKHYTKNGKKTLCYFDLTSPSDAYEWSFVAVPAQPMAGVVKSYTEKGIINFGGMSKSVENGTVMLTAAEAEELRDSIAALKKTAESAGEFLKRRKTEVMSLFSRNCSDEAEQMIMKALDSLEPQELYKLYGEAKRVGEKAEAQLFSKKQRAFTGSNSDFIV